MKPYYRISESRGTPESPCLCRGQRTPQRVTATSWCTSVSMLLYFSCWYSFGGDYVHICFPDVRWSRAWSCSQNRENKNGCSSCARSSCEQVAVCRQFLFVVSSNLDHLSLVSFSSSDLPSPPPPPLHQILRKTIEKPNVDNTRTHTTDIEVLDAQKLDEPPLCVAHVPWHMGTSFHGIFTRETYFAPSTLS